MVEYILKRRFVGALETDMICYVLGFQVLGFESSDCLELLLSVQARIPTFAAA